MDSHRNISITLLVAVPALVVLFIILDALGRLRRGSYERYVLRWVKRKGAPGDDADSSAVVTYSHVCKFNLAKCLCFLATHIVSKPVTKEQKTWLLPWRLQRQGMTKTSQHAVQFAIDTASHLFKSISLIVRGICMRSLCNIPRILLGLDPPPPPQGEPDKTSDNMSVPCLNRHRCGHHSGLNRCGRVNRAVGVGKPCSGL